MDKLFRKLFKSEQRYNLVYGGAGSGKSVSMSIFMLMWALVGRSILSTIKVASKIRSTTWAAVIKVMRDNDLSKFFDVVESKKQIISKLGKGSIEFIGLDDEDKLRSMTPPRLAAFTDVVCEEATEMSSEIFKQLCIRQRGKTKFNKRIWLIFNPIMKTHWIYKRFLEKHENNINFRDVEIYEELKDNKLLVCKSTYRNNAFLEEEDIETLRDQGKEDKYYEDVFLNGNFGVLGKLVFENVKILKQSDFRKEFESNRSEWLIRLGIDSGFRDFQTFTINLYNKRLRRLVTVEEIAMTHVADVTPYVAAIKQKLQLWGLPFNHIITADSSDPRIRELLNLQGLNIRPAIKGAGSKWAGLLWMKTLSIEVIDTCVMLIESYNSYVWKKDKQGNSLQDTLHTGSDLIDSIRYAHELDQRGGGTKFGRR
jgi:phage terminase large subunit